MIRVERVPEPAGFDAKVRQPGNAWLRANPRARRPKAFWTPFKCFLADGFRDLCGYSAMYEPVGTVDHFVSYRSDPSQTYEWSNYRFAAQWINSCKQTLDSKVLDPFEVEDGWFEIILPSLQLVITDKVPAAMRERAQTTLKKLHLRDDERVIRQRRSWYTQYQEGKLSLQGLDERAPLIARAVRKQQRTRSPGQNPDPEPE